MPRIVLLTVMTLGLLAQTAAATAPTKIVGGTLAGASEYPAQGYMEIEVSPGRFGACGGTLLSRRKFVTAAHCSVGGDNQPLPPSAFLVLLGENDLNDVQLSELYGVSRVEVHEGYPGGEGAPNDVAMLTLERDADPGLATMRLVRPTETALWAAGIDATIIGWGATTARDADSEEDPGPTSDLLREAALPIVLDSECNAAYASFGGIDPDTMVCAGDGAHDTCQGDSGGPLLVPFTSALTLAGIVSFGLGCADPDFPGVYTRIGAPELNSWVRGRRSEVDFVSAEPRQAGQPVSFMSTSAAGNGSFAWDFDGDGITDASGPAASHTFASAGSYPVTLRALDAEGQPADRTHAVGVGAPAVVPTPPPNPGLIVDPPLIVPTPTLRLASLIVNRRATVDRRGRFGIRINFSRNAPAGKKAVVKVRRRQRTLGGARVRVARGKSAQAKVRLTKSGLRRLRRAQGRRLKVTLRVTLTGSLPQSKTVLLVLKR